MAKLEEMGEFVRSASSTIEAPVVRRLKEAFNGGGAGRGGGDRWASASGGRDQGRRERGGLGDRPRGDRPVRTERGQSAPVGGQAGGTAAPAAPAPATTARPVP